MRPKIYFLTNWTLKLQSSKKAEERDLPRTTIGHSEHPTSTHTLPSFTLDGFTPWLDSLGVQGLCIKWPVTLWVSGVALAACLLTLCEPWSKAQCLVLLNRESRAGRRYSIKSQVPVSKPMSFWECLPLTRLLCLTVVNVLIKMCVL